MSALDGILKKKYEEASPIERCLVLGFDGSVRLKLLEAAAVELAALEHLAAVARDVNEWLKTIDMGGTGHQRSLEAALAELEKK